MRLNEVQFTDAVPVEGYGPGFFRLGGTLYRGPVVTGPAGTDAWGGYTDIEPLKRLAGQVDVLLLGTGREIAFAPEMVRKAVEKMGIGLEVMSSPSAARTYNVLLGEGRRIALAMMPVEQKTP